MATVRRLEGGGRIDRDTQIGFTFQDTAMTGLAGDTLASALLANGVSVVGTGPYLGRPRGIYGAGTEEPNAFVQIGAQPMTQATRLPLHEGIDASPLHEAKGRLLAAADEGFYDKAMLHADVLVVGAGPAGLAAATTAAASGARVVLVDEDTEPGGSLLGAPQEIDGGPAGAWIAEQVEQLRAAEECRVLLQATALGLYDGNDVLVQQRRGADRGRLWRVRAQNVVVAAGSHERPIAFADNDRPGVMLASAARTYLNRFGVLVGERAVLFGTNDSIYLTAADLLGAGAEIALIVDARQAPSTELARSLGDAGVEIVSGAVVTSVAGASSVVGADVRLSDGSTRSVECDLLAVSGGFNPVAHLVSHVGARQAYDPAKACFVTTPIAAGVSLAGAAKGSFTLDACLREGAEAGAHAANAAGFACEVSAGPRVASEQTSTFAELWLVEGASEATSFVDLNRDATIADVRRAVDAGVTSVEHIKRYTTIGTGADQGKTSGVLVAGVSAELLGRGVGEIGVSTIRPPYVPVTFAQLAGRHRGDLHDPERVTPIHAWHVAREAAFEDVGQWKRPWYYPRDGEDMDGAVLRECAAARSGVAMMDASTLGKILIDGSDAAEFLNRIYTNRYDTLKVGMARYGVMCHADGMVFDDGVVMRLDERRFLATTTTGGAADVLNWFEEWRQTEWPGLDVHFTSVTEQWATIGLVGPKSRQVLARLAPDIDLDNDAFPFMAIRDGVVAGMPARVVRVSFSGELAYEVNVAGWDGLAMWEAIFAAGEPEAITPYGTETMHVLRAEKGFVIVGQDTDGTVTPYDLGMSWIVSKKKGDFVGLRSLTRPDSARKDRLQLVGLLPTEPEQRLAEGAQLVLDPDQPVPMDMIGHVTSSYMSAALGRTFALALVSGGLHRTGQLVYAPDPGGTIEAEITEPVFYDKEGARRDG